MADYYIDKNGKLKKRDKAPKTDNTNSPKTLFQKGAFEDGYQFGDVTNAAVGTVADAGVGFLKGAGRLVEGIVDLGGYGVAGIADLFGADNFADKTRKAMQIDAVGKMTKGIDEELDKYSLLGYYGDAVAEGIGQIGTVILTGGAAAGSLGAVGATALTSGLMGASSMGSGIGEAYQGGATDKEAWAYGAMKGAVDMASEWIFGGLGKGVKALGFGKGLSSIDDVFARKVSGLITKHLGNETAQKLLGNAVEYAIKSGAEGVEEVLAGIGTAYAKKFSYMSKKDIDELIKDENLLEQFIVGSLTSAIAQGGDMFRATKNRTDFVTGHTSSEQKIIDNEVNRIIEERRANGEKVKKSDVYNDVEYSLKKGYIGTDTIESIVGENAYNEYKKASDTEKAETERLKNEISSLEEKINASEDISSEDRQKLSSLRSELNDLTNNSKVKELKEKLDNVVREKIKGTSLVESYNEIERQNEKFKVEDLSQYTAKEQKIVQKAIDSGVLNNTNRIHELVDLVAKLSAHLDTDFDFVNNEKLKESGFAIEGKGINGFVNENGITINTQSSKYLNSVVGHEITHVLKGSNLFDGLQKPLFDYAKAKGEYDTRLKNIEKAYEGIENVDVNEELTADLVGDYLFTDRNFVEHLLNTDRNVFEKIYDELKYLCKIATTGSKEEKALLKAKKIFDDVYREGKKNEVEGVRYSVEKIGDINYVKAEKNIFIKEDGTLSSEKDVFNSLVGKTISLPDGDIKIVKRLPRKDMYNELSRRYPKQLGNVKNVKRLNSSVNYNMEELLENSELKTPNEPDQKNKHQAQGIKGFDTRRVNFYDGSKAYNIEFSIGILQNGEKIAYAKKYFGYDEKLTKKIQSIEVRSNQSPLNQRSVQESVPPSAKIIAGVGSKPLGKTLSTNSISNSDENVNSKFSLSSDTDVAPEGNFKITSDDVTLKTKNVLGDDIPIRKDATNKVNSKNVLDDDIPIRSTTTLDKLKKENGFSKGEKSYVSMEDFANSESPLWRNVDYEDDATKSSIMQQTHNEMVFDGVVVKVSDDTQSKVGDAFPDLRDVKKKERALILKESINKLKSNLRQFLGGFKNQAFEFEVNGKVLEAKLYNTGINEVLEKVTENKANMLYTTEEVFKNARYLYSTPDYDSDPNVYRWNYFYTPVQIGDEIVGVRIAVRDIAQGQNHTPESQIYNWGIKKETSLGDVQPVNFDSSHGTSSDASLEATLDGVRDDFENRKSYDVSSDASSNIISNSDPKVNNFDSNSKEKERSWAKTSTESDVVGGQILAEDLSKEARVYVPVSNEKTLNVARENIIKGGYDKSINKAVSLIESKGEVSLIDIAECELLISEALKRGDTKTAGEIIENVAILGTELGQKVQALSLINRMTPEGQLRTLEKIVKRNKQSISGKTKEDVPYMRDKSFANVEITPEMKDKILSAYNEDGSWEQEALDKAVEDVKQMIADQMNVSFREKANAWRYLSMLGNPKTHVRNIVSNVAMTITLEGKNAIARTAETLFSSKLETRTKTWKKATKEVTDFSKEVTEEMEGIFRGESKYSDVTDIKSKRNIFESEILQKIYGFNSRLLSKEDVTFKKHNFKKAFSEFLTANGIRSVEDIEANSKLVEKGKVYALEQAEIATFQQHSVLASEINRWANNHDFLGVGLDAVLPFKKTPINIAKTGLNYSPLGFAKTLTKDLQKLRQGEIDATTLIDNISQNITGTGLMLLGFYLASQGILNGAGEDDEESQFDYQLGEQRYSITIGNSTYAIDWLSPVAMPLFVGTNAYETFIKKEEWSPNVVIEALAKTADPLSEMSVLSSLDNVLSSYSGGTQRIGEMAKEMTQSYIGQYIPTILSQTAATFDDTKRTTKASSDSKFTWGEEILRSMMYKIPGLRNLLEPSIDIWGNRIKQNDNIALRAIENFASPALRKELNRSKVNVELKDVYREVGESSVFPNIPKSSVTYKKENHPMSAKEYSAFREKYGQTAYNTLKDLFETETYKNSSDDEKADLIEKVYTYAKDESKKEYLDLKGVEYTNSSKDKVPYYKENSIKGAVENDISPEEYELSVNNPEKYALISNVFGYDEYQKYKSALNQIEGKNTKEKKWEYVENLKLSAIKKAILYKSEYNSYSYYDDKIFEYIESLKIPKSEKEKIARALGFKVKE